MWDAVKTIWYGKQKAWIAALMGYVVALAAQFIAGTEVEPGVIEAFRLETTDLVTSILGAIITGVPAYAKGNWPKEPSATGTKLQSSPIVGVLALLCAGFGLSACAGYDVPFPPPTPPTAVVTDEQVARCLQRQSIRMGLELTPNVGANTLAWARHLERLACTQAVLDEIAWRQLTPQPAMVRVLPASG